MWPHTFLNREKCWILNKFVCHVEMEVAAFWHETFWGGQFFNPFRVVLHQLVADIESAFGREATKFSNRHPCGWNSHALLANTWRIYLYILKNNALQPLFQARTHGSPSANTIFDFVFGRMGWFWKEPFGIVLTVNSTQGQCFSVQCSVFFSVRSLLQFITITVFSSWWPNLANKLFLCRIGSSQSIILSVAFQVVLNNFLCALCPTAASYSGLSTNREWTRRWHSLH